MSRGRTLAALLLVSILGQAAAANAASLFDPARRFRTITTDHFIIYFHQGEERTGRRLATIAEDTWPRLHERFKFAPRRTHVVLVDQSELANGYATPQPRNTIVVSASWPPGSDFLGDTDDWLRLVFTHEFTHIVHLDRSAGWARVVRDVLGRVPYAFPNLYLPTWQIEGLATYEESAITGTGRLHAGDFGAVVAEETRTHTLQPLDRVNGGLTAWPGGSAAYAYGLGFHQYLADRFGAATLGALADATARRVPYTTAPVFRRIYGQSLGELWRDYESALLAATPPAPPADSGIRRLTHDGYIAIGPRFDRDPAGAAERASIVYSTRSPHGFPALNRVDSAGAAPTRLTTRYLGSTTAIGRDYLYFDQQELGRNVGLYSDLYVLARGNGHVTRLTHDKRLLDPDLSPDGTTLVCVRNAPGQRDLVLVKLTGATAVGGITTLLSAVETQFDAPRWSPDGRTIAVERHQPGRLSDLVLLDVATRAVRVLAGNARARVVTPAWRPDGRAIVAAIAFEDQPFNLYEMATDGTAPPRQLTHTTGGATWPDVSHDGSAIAFVGYTTAGNDIFTMPYPVETDVAAAAPALILPPSTSTPSFDPPEFPSKVYSPIPTLHPTSWSPIVESDGDQIRAGAALGAYDALGYHFYAASATWLVSGPPGTPAPSVATPDWSASYAYDRWQPTFWIATSQATSFLHGPATDDDTPTGGTLRERQLNVGVIYPMRHARQTHTASFSFVRGVDEYTLPTRMFSRGRGAGRAAWASSTAHSYGYSISPEHGVVAGTTVENDRMAFGAFAPAAAVTADARAYLPSFSPHHVLAIRVAGGRATGDPAVRRTFDLGGPGPDANVADFSRSAISLLRGFPANTFAGSHVALANIDYRLPLARPERGVGTWPVFLHTVHAGLFADAGHAWTRTFRPSAIKLSVGGELSADIVAGYFFRFTATAGVARGHDGSGAVPDRTTAYLRIGKAF